MEIYNNYKEYRKLKPQYAAWDKESNLQNAKRLEYLNQNPISEEQKNQDIESGKALLRAIDVMDEYSQSYAEDSEIGTEIVTKQVTTLTTYLGMGLGLLFSFTKSGKTLAEKLPKELAGIGGKGFIAVGFGMLAAIATAIPMAGWTAIQQVKASRNGRFEAMKTDLANPAQFAILTEEQKKEIEENAQKIPDSEIKLKEKQTKGIFADIKNPFKRIKEAFSKNEELDKKRAEFDKSLEADPENFNKTLSAKDIEKAKKDQQLLAKLVQKIDIASQDYTENIEFATNTVQALALAGGGLMTFLSAGLMSLLKVKNSTAKWGISAAIGAIIPIGISIIATKIQKQAARVARFKVKQEMETNPRELVYIDDEKAKKIDAKAPEKEKKKNFIQYLKEIYDENKKYNKHLKGEGLKEKKFSIALNSIKLNEEQEKEAKVLQKNTFKTFNKVDEKSQLYSESTEAFWEIVKTPIVLVLEIAGLCLGTLAMAKNVSKNTKLAEIIPIIAPILGIIPAIGAAIGIDAWATKEQKMASRVADMEAIKALGDYKNYVDYDNLSTNSNEKVEKVPKKETETKLPGFTLSDFKNSLAMKKF